MGFFHCGVGENQKAWYEEVDLELSFFSYILQIETVHQIFQRKQKKSILPSLKYDAITLGAGGGYRIVHNKAESESERTGQAEGSAAGTRWKFIRSRPWGFF